MPKTATKNMMRGAMFTAIYITMTMVIPILTFTYIKNLSVQGYEITMTQKRYQMIVYWIASFGFLISGCAFFAYSSPKHSIRRAGLSLGQILLNCLYLWSYKFSGATDIEFDIVDLGLLSLDFSQMIMLYLGIYFLVVILKLYDLADFTINRKKIREKRIKKTAKKEAKK